MRSVLCRLPSTPSEGVWGKTPPRFGFMLSKNGQKSIRKEELTTLKGLTFSRFS